MCEPPHSRDYSAARLFCVMCCGMPCYFIAISIGWLMGGIVVIENVFNYPGMGSELVSAVSRKNIPVLQAITLIIVFIFALANLLADLLYAMLNPRIRLE
jgi:peptide/nickel transport system permease protein